MRFSSASLAVLAASAATVAAEDKYLGFNSGATYDDGSIKTKADFKKEFESQQKLEGAPGKFNAVRLYTNIKPGTENSPEPIEAFSAAVETKTKLLLGLWASGTTSVDKELAALTKAIKDYGKDFTDLVVGISVGSEDLYRVSVDGIANKAGVGNDVDVLTKFVKDTRDKLKDTDLKNTPIGHVDTWNVWANGSIAGFIKEVDFLGVDLYPYYENGKNIPIEGGNDIKNAFPLFQTAMNATLKAAGDKPVWITETGWPVTGPTWEPAAVPSTDNAKQFWQQVGCYYFGKVNTFWYIQRDSNPDNKMKFGLAPKLDGKPLFDLSCPSDIKRPSVGGSLSGNSTSTGNGTSTSGNSTSGGNSTGNSTSSSSPYSNSTSPYSNSTSSNNGNLTYSGSNSPSAPGSGSNGAGSGSRPGGAPGSASSPAANANAGSMTKTNAAALALSMVFAVAAWAL